MSTGVQEDKARLAAADLDGDGVLDDEELDALMGDVPPPLLHPALLCPTPAVAGKSHMLGGTGPRRLGCV